MDLTQRLIDNIGTLVDINVVTERGKESALEFLTIFYSQSRPTLLFLSQRSIALVDCSLNPSIQMNAVVTKARVILAFLGCTMVNDIECLAKVEEADVDVFLIVHELKNCIQSA